MTTWRNMSRPWLDGTSHGVAVSSSSLATGTLTTTRANDLIVAFVWTKKTAGGSYFTVSSMSATGVTGWTQKYQSQHGTFGSGAFANFEVWYGTASSTIAGAVTATLSGAADRAIIVAFGVNGAATSSMFDDNSGAPYQTFQDSGSNSGTHNQTYSTVNPNDLIIEFAADVQGNYGFGATPDTEWVLAGEDISSSCSMSVAVASGIKGAQSSVTHNIWGNYNSGVDSLRGIFAIKAPVPPAAQDYNNPGGSGNRYLFNTTATVGGGEPMSMVDGAITATSAYPGGWFWNSGQTTANIVFDWFTARIIDEAKWYQSNSTTHGTWKWQGSSDGITYVDIGTSFTLGGSTTQTQTQLNGNTTAYRFYRLQPVSASTSNSPFLEEIEFKIDDATTIPGTGTTSYANPGGTGDRTRMSTTAAAGGSSFFFRMLDGDFTPSNSSSPGSWFWNSGQSSKQIVWDFFTKRVIDEATWYQDTTDTHGTWKWQGSNDNSAYTDIGVGFTLGGLAQVHDQLNGNTTAWRYYRLLQTGGTTSNGPFLEEIEFRIDAGVVVADDTTIVQTLQALTQSAHIVESEPTHIAQTLTALTQSLLCSVSPVAHIAQTLQKITQDMIVQPGANVIIQTLSVLRQEADINVASSSHIAQTLQPLTQLLTAAAPVTSTIAQTLQKITQVVTANTPPRFRIAQTLQPVIQLMQETEHVPHFVNAGVQQHFLSSTVTPPLPASLVVGNLLIAFVYFQDGSGFTATWPAGWTPIDAQQDTNGNAGGAYAYHYVTGGDTAPVISMSAGSDFSAQINQYADVDDTYPVGNFQHTSGFSPDLMSAGLESSGTNSLIVMWNTYRTDPGTDIPGYTLENRQTTSDAMAWFDVVVPNDNTTTASVDQVVHVASNSQWQCFMFELLAPFEGVRVVMHPTEPTDIFAGTLFPTDKGDMNITEPTDTLYHPGDAIFPDAHIGWFVFFPPLGTIAITEHTDIAHFAVFTPPHGTMNLTEFVDRCHAIGYVPGTATMDMTETADSFAAIGWVPGTADFNPTENKDRFLAIGLGATPPKRRRVFIVT